MELETDTTRIMADHGIIPAETLNPIEATHAAAEQFGHPHGIETAKRRGPHEPDPDFQPSRASTASHQLDAMTAKALAYREVLRDTRGKLDIARRQRNDAMTERDALKAEVENLRMALQVEIMFSDFVAAKFSINPDELCFTVHVRPDGQEVGSDRKPDGSEAASITWAEVHAGSRIVLRAEPKGGA